MSDKEIEMLKKSLFIEGKDYIESTKLWTKEQRQLNKELSCREMIMSCLAYGTDIYTSHYVMDYNEELGKERVLELCKEQENYVKTKCKIVRNVYTDSEDVTYNSIVEVEE